MRVQIDSLVRGRVGSTEKIDEMRVFRITSFGHVAGINGDGNQSIMNAGNFEVIGEPRPQNQRRDIPERLR